MSDRDPLLAILRGLHDALAQLADTTHWAAERARVHLVEVDRLLREQEQADRMLVPQLLAAEINALPKRVRDYIHHLETDADPAGDKWHLAAAQENVAALTALLAELERPEDASGFQLVERMIAEGRSDE